MIKYLLSNNKVEWESPDLKKRNGDPDTAVPHIPIFASKNVGTSPRVVVLFGESFQDLGIFAQRIIGREGGINAGSVISFVQHINATEIDAQTGVPLSEKQTTSMEVKMVNPEEIDLVDGETEAPAIILANTGQLRWCRSLGKAMTFTSWNALTRPSAVDECVHYDPIRNSVAGHRDIGQHVDQILTTVIPKLCGRDAKIEIMAIADSCKYVPLSLDRNWSSIAPRMQSMALIDPDFAQPESYTNPLFKAFLLQRTRGFVKDSTVPANTPMFGPSGGAYAWEKGFGYNIYSIPDESVDESVFPRHFLNVLEWQAKLASDPKHCEDELTIKTFGEDADALGADIDTTVKTHAEIEAEIKLGHEQGLLNADFWDTPDGVEEITRKEDELTEAKKAMAKGASLEEYKEEDDRVKNENENTLKESGGIGTLKQTVWMKDATEPKTESGNGNAVADVKAVAMEVAKEALKEHAYAKHSKTEANSTRNTNSGALFRTTSPHIQTQIRAVPSNNDTILEALLQDLTNKKKSGLIDLPTKPNVSEGSNPAAAAIEQVKEDTEPTAPAQQKKSIFEQQGFGYHEMSTEDKELGFTRFKWLTDEEAAEAEKEMADAEKARKKAKEDEKKARANRLGKAERKALLNAQIEPRKLEVFREDGVEEMPTEGAGLPPTVDDATEICSKTSVEEATKGLINDMKILDMATHTALPAAPQDDTQVILKNTKASAMDEISDDEEEVAPRPRKLEKHVSFEDQAPHKPAESGGGSNIRSFDGANDDDFSHDIMDRIMAAAKPVISFETAVQKKLAAQGGKRFQRSLKGAVVERAVSPAVSPFVSGTMQKGGLGSTSYAKLFNEEAKKEAPLLEVGGDGATDEDAYLSCPPERMERLPSVVVKTLHQGKPEVKLSKDEKAAILQTTVLSSPVKGGMDEASLRSEEERSPLEGGGENRKISVVTLDN